MKGRSMLAGTCRVAVTWGALLCGLLVALACQQQTGQPVASEAGQNLDAADASIATLPHRVSLVDHARWERVSAEDDPAGDRPADVSCLPEATTVELLGTEVTYGVETAHCNYLAVEQRTLVAVPAGATIAVRLWHFALSAKEPAQAHARVLVAGRVVLDEIVPIPSDGGLVTAELIADQPLAVGATVHFHLHNHGENTWALVEISAAL